MQSTFCIAAFAVSVSSLLLQGRMRLCHCEINQRVKTVPACCICVSSVLSLCLSLSRYIYICRCSFLCRFLCLCLSLFLLLSLSFTFMPLFAVSLCSTRSINSHGNGTRDGSFLSCCWGEQRASRGDVSFCTRRRERGQTAGSGETDLAAP